MSDVMQNIQTAIDALETELAGIDDKRADIEKTLAMLRRLVDEGVTPNGRGRRVKARRIVKRNGAVARVKPAKPEQRGDTIIGELRRLGGAASPGKLASALKMDRATLRYQLKPLLSQKLVVATGATANRMISLPGKAPGKEGL